MSDVMNVSYDTQIPNNVGLSSDRRVLRACLAALDGLTAAELKPLLGNTSRKWAIPVLEYLDRQRVTVRRQGQAQPLAQHRVSVSELPGHRPTVGRGHGQRFAGRVH